MTEQTLPYDPDAPDIRLHEHFLGVQDRFRARHDKALADIAKLYHYTTAEGFKSILEGREFWATHVAHLNDSSELEYGLNLLHSRLDVLANDRQNKYVNAFIDAAHEQFHFSVGLLFAAYVVCFCENGNLLSQWRGYGSGGGGYSIGLSPHRTSADRLDGEARVLDDHGLLHLRQVIYDESEQKSLLDDLLAGLVPILERHGPVMHPERFREEIVEYAVMRMQMALADLLPCFKNPSFEEEQEWRYVYFATRYPVPNQRFRVRNGNFVPFLPLRLLGKENGPLQVSKVFCGPTLNSHLTANTVHELTEALGHTGVEVLPSGIPLRF
jgi:hypothetical protein